MAGPRNSHGKRSSSHSDHNDNGRSKRRNNGDDRGKISINSDDTVYRYLCPSNKIGSIMGRGGDIIKQLRSETNSKIRIGETVSGCEERVITIYSTNDETNKFDETETETDQRVCPSQDALFKVHDRVVADEVGPNEVADMAPQVTARLLVPSDQIGCVIGKGGQVVQTIRTETSAQIRIMKDNHLPTCALTNDELIQISGEASVVRKALFQIASRLHDNPSRSQQHLLASSTMYPSVMGTPGGAPIMGLTPLLGGYKSENGTLYPASRRESSSKEFSLRLICPSANIGGVIGKGGAIINQIRQDSGASVKVDSSTTDAEDCIISISAKEIFEDSFSPTIDAAIRLQSRCSERVERDSGLLSFTTRLLVQSSHIGSIIGKGGSIISEMRRITQANIRILSKENLPKVAKHDDEMVQICGDVDDVKDALVQVASRLRANLFDREGVFSSFVQVLPYLPIASPEVSRYESRDSKGHGHRYGDSYDFPPHDGYGSYAPSHGRSGGPGDGYGSSYGGSSYSPRRSGGGSRRLSRHDKSPTGGFRRRGYGY
ncbi:KH domain-containing protein HEN4 [Lactuca sativa]|uniref:KH domain-containing protein HEN4 n=1 Tax=Lactuca sativa TaxID=4236 RepID=UPI000CD96C87|nr:KH domain-containing protein HEN4 [Lactuca sativa]XP_023731950.1 KH domain-containing protein HEN4 [Lactuca sativa]XP_023731951.1 KH domain-containing protein HEN4 [Lactuca sativa]